MKQAARMKNSLALLGLILMAAQSPAQSYTVLKNFSGSDGEQSYAGLTLSGNTLYGTTASGGSSGWGTVFKVNTDGTGYTVVFDFSTLMNNTNHALQALNPQTRPVLSGNTLYGTTDQNYWYEEGTIYSVNSDGSDYTAIYIFPPGGGNGNSPRGDLLLAGNTLYGTTYQGGGSGNGNVFKVNTDGTGFTVLKDFSALNSNTNSDGAQPFAGLTLSGNTLYGTTTAGGATGNGTVFSVNTDGSDFTVLKEFSSINKLPTNIYGNSDGGVPRAGLTLSGSTLYGTTQQGGTNGGGTIFAINTDGTGYTVLWNFDGGVWGSGNDSLAGLTLVGSTLYGTTQQGGKSSFGVVFQINTDGTSYTVLKNFSAMSSYPINNGGAYSWAVPVLSGSELYGTTFLGGSSGNGTVFKLDLASLFNTTLNIMQTNNQAVLTWIDPDFSLQSAPAVTGPYTDTGATSPYTDTMTSGQQYFRLVNH